MVTPVKLLLFVALHESGTRNAVLDSLLSNTEVYLTPFISTQNHTIAGGGRRGHDHMFTVGFTTTCANTKDVSSNLVHGEVYSIQHYVIKIVSDL